MNSHWENIINNADFAFQPIVHPCTGVTYAVEALIRNIDPFLFPSIDSLFDKAFNEKILFSLDLALREKAIKKFTQITWHDRIKLFYNYDPRMFMMPDYKIGETEKILEKYKIPGDKICFELSEKYRFNMDQLNILVRTTKQRGLKIALDDFGTGFSGLEVLYNSNPDFIKFDRFLISGIDESARKKAICKNLINIAKIFGAVVIAEGIETKEELFICRELGFDLVQGFFIEKPVLQIEDMDYVNRNIADNKKNERNFFRKNISIKKYIEKPSVIYNFENTDKIISLFKDEPDLRVIPVLDSNDYPVGIITDRSVREYIYTPCGYSLFLNKSIDAPIEKFMDNSPVADINSTEEDLVSLFLCEYDCSGIIITWNLEYYGFIPASEIIMLMSKSNHIKTYQRAVI
jgi:EAL domain-containing protein (putative c-di-GMP-specific phosphodiesterase class I)/CBS domain-containing protein